MQLYKRNTRTIDGYRLGKIVTLKDIHNTNKNEKTKNVVNTDLKTLVVEMKKDKGTMVELVVNDKSELNAVFYQTNSMKVSFNNYPGLLLIDATYKLNDLRMSLYVLMTVEGNGESVIVALWIVANEEKHTISTLMDLFLQYNKKSNHVRVIMADKDLSNYQIIKLSKYTCYNVAA